MIAVDTNILVYAHRRDSPWYGPAAQAIASLAQSPARWAIPWPCIHEFFGIVTHPRIYDPSSSVEAAVDQIEAWLECPSVELVGEGPGYWKRLGEALRRGRITGPRVHDARIAVICTLHGVRELWTADRDFSRFPEIPVRNPLQD